AAPERRLLERLRTGDAAGGLVAEPLVRLQVLRVDDVPGPFGTRLRVHGERGWLLAGHHRVRVPTLPVHEVAGLDHDLARLLPGDGDPVGAVLAAALALEGAADPLRVGSPYRGIGTGLVLRNLLRGLLRGFLRRSRQRQACPQQGSGDHGYRCWHGHSPGPGGSAASPGAAANSAAIWLRKARSRCSLRLSSLRRSGSDRLDTACARRVAGSRVRYSTSRQAPARRSITGASIGHCSPSPSASLTGGNGRAPPATKPP